MSTLGTNNTTSGTADRGTERTIPPTAAAPRGGSARTSTGSAASEEDGLFASDRTLDQALNDPNAAAVLSNTPGTGGPTGANATGGGWAIPLGTFSLENHRETAAAFRDQFQASTRMTGAWVDSSRTDRSIVWYGQYDGHSDPRLVADLDRLRTVSIEGAQPFRKVLPSMYRAELSSGSIPQYSLRRVREMFPGRDRIFTLQVGFFEPDKSSNMPLAQQAAEEFVTQLRAQGEPAFYYHGPTKSMVLVGIFFEDAIDPALAVDPLTGYGAEVVAMQQRFPYNLDNGRQLIERHSVPSSGTRGGRRTVETPQPSFLIEVPKW